MECWGALALLLTVYLVVPAARVRPQCAAIGAFCASVVIIGLKGMLSAYFEHAFGMSRLYGSLGLVPVFMFWMWVVWVTVLGGLQVAAFAQTIRARGLMRVQALTMTRTPIQCWSWR